MNAWIKAVLFLSILSLSSCGTSKDKRRTSKTKLNKWQIAACVVRIRTQGCYEHLEKSSK